MNQISSVFRKELFHSKVAIVTGGGTGIGAAITKELLHLGCNVMISSRNEEKLKKAAEDFQAVCEQPGAGKVLYQKCNIRKEDEVKDMISSTISKFGALNFLINNGGGQFASPAQNISLKGWHAVVETNLTGTFLCIREAFKQYMEVNGGVIVNIVLDTLKGFPGMSHSSAARAGVQNLTKSLAVEWAPCGVRINCIAPGVIYSESAAENYKQYGDLLQYSGSNSPARRCGNVEEISGVVAFLLSPAASYLTGQTVYVDGAISLYRPQNWEVPDHDNFKAFSWSGEDSRKSKL